jgi:hypothetical protein
MRYLVLLLPLLLASCTIEVRSKEHVDFKVIEYFDDKNQLIQRWQCDLYGLRDGHSYLTFYTTNNQRIQIVVGSGYLICREPTEEEVANKRNGE